MTTEHDPFSSMNDAGSYQSHHEAKALLTRILPRGLSQVKKGYPIDRTLRYQEPNLHSHPVELHPPSAKTADLTSVLITVRRSCYDNDNPNTYSLGTLVDANDPVFK